MEQNLTFNRACRRNVQIIVFCDWFGLTLYEKSFWHFESPGKEFKRALSVRNCQLDQQKNIQPMPHLK